METARICDDVRALTSEDVTENRLRLYKLKQLTSTTDYVNYYDRGEQSHAFYIEGRKLDHDEGRNLDRSEYELLWPFPRNKRVAYIDASTGNVERFYQWVDTRWGSDDVDLWSEIINKHISRLARAHVKDISAKQLIRHATLTIINRGRG